MSGTRPKPVGRPSKYTKALGDLICERLASGESMRTVAKGDDMPSMQTIFSWLRLDPSFLEQYTRAKEEAADALVEDMLDIADDGSNDYMKNQKGEIEYHGDHVQRSRLRVDTRKWIAAKLKPKKYGDKLDLTTKGKELPTPILGSASLVRSDNSDSEDPQTP